MSGDKVYVLLAAFCSVFSIFMYYYLMLRHKKKTYEGFLNFSNIERRKAELEYTKEGLFGKIHKMLVTSKIKLDVNQFIEVSVLSGVICGILSYLLTEYVLMAVLCAFGGTLIPYLYVSNKIRQRTKEIVAQFPLMLKHMVNYLHVGNNLYLALEKTAIVTDGALGEMMEEILKRISGGLSITQAIDVAYDEIKLIEFKMFYILINIHYDMGGDLASSLENLVNIIEDQKILRSEIDTLTKETRISSYLTAIVPAVMYVLLRTSSPDYMKQLDKMSWGKIGLVFSFVFIIVGVLIVKKMSDIKVDKTYR